MEPPFGDAPTIPMLPPRDDDASQQPRARHVSPHHPQQYPPAPPPSQAPYPYQMAPYTPRVRQSLAGPGAASGAGAATHHTHRMPRVHALALAGRLKRWSIALAVAAFVAFVGLAAGHVTGVTAAQAGSSSSSSNNASPQNNDDDGGFFGGQNNNNGGGFFGSGGSGSPSSGTSVS